MAKAVKTKVLQVTHAEYVGDLKLEIFFSDGSSKKVDFEPFILAHPHPQYNKYLDPKNFQRFSIEQGNVVWGKNWDLVFPIEQLHKGASL